MSTKEPRHEDIVENLGVMIGKVQNFSIGYNPFNSALTIENLIKSKTLGRSAIDAVTVAETNSKLAISARATILEDFDSHITRVANIIRVCGVNSQTIDQILSIVREIQGKRVSEKLTDEEIATAKAQGNEIKQVVKHNSQIKTRTNNYGKLIQYLSSIPEYNPNEEDLKITSLTKRLNNLIEKNETVDATTAALEKARTNRDKVLYTENTGLVDIAKAVKTYTKAAFGANSNEYQQIGNIAFINR